MNPKMKTKSALPYFGSDSEVAAKLAAMLNGRQHVTIPFVGGASIIPHLTARAIVANDLNDLAINFYRYASGSRGMVAQCRLFELCQATLSHPSEIEHAANLIGRRSKAIGVHEAWAYWALCWIGRKGKGGTPGVGGMPSVRRTPSGGTNASRIIAAVDDLARWAWHFRRCEWESLCFRELLPKVADDPRCGIYADAPWVGAGKAYVHAFDKLDHIDLANLLGRFSQTAVVIRYGDEPLIRELYAGWDITVAESRTQANKQAAELWIRNAAAVSGASPACCA